MVADDSPRVAVDDQRDVAVGAAPVPPARTAGKPGREAAPVDHHDRLRAGVPHLAQRLPGGRVQGARARVGLAHVEHLDRRHAAPVDAARQLDPRQLQPRLGSRRRRAGDQRRAAFLGAAAGDGAGVVAGVALLLVGGIVLLVDHDQAEVADRREDGGAGADADARLAAAQAPPLVVALAGRERRVQDREAIAEPRAEARHRLRGQGRSRERGRSRPARGRARPRPRPGRPRSCPSR